MSQGLSDSNPSEHIFEAKLQISFPEMVSRNVSLPHVNNLNKHNRILS